MTILEQEARRSGSITRKPRAVRRYLSPGWKASKLPGLSDLSVASDGTIWGVDSTTGALINLLPGQPWTIAGVNFVDIAVLTSGATWGLNTTGDFLSYDPEGPTIWRSLATPPGATLKLISAGSPWNILGLDSIGNLWTYDPGSDGWLVHSSITLSEVSASTGGSAWGLTPEGAPCRYDPDQQSWEPVGAPEPFKSIDAPSDDWVWAVGASGTLYQFNPDPNPSPQWIPAEFPPPVSAISVSCGDDLSLWMIGSDGQTYSFDPFTNGWVTESANFALIAVADAETIWGIDSAGLAYRDTSSEETYATYTPNVPIVQISVAASGQLWGIDAKGYAYQSTDGINWAAIETSGYCSISAASDGTVAVVTQDFGVVTLLSGDDGDEISLSAEFQAVSVSVGGASNIVALSKEGVVYKYENQDGQGVWYRQSRSLTFVNISTSADGSTWGVTTGGEIAQQYKKDLWFVTAAKGRAVAVGSSTDVWIIDPAAIPREITANAPITPEEMLHLHASAMPRWDTEDVYDETKSTHLWILRRGALLAGTGGTVGQRICQLINPNVVHQAGFHDRLYQGLYDADFKAPYNGPTVAGQPTYLAHFCDPDDRKNYVGTTSPTALTEGMKHFNAAVGYYQLQDLANAGYHLGLSTHYFTDLTQPLHAANFPWGASGPWLTYHTDLESYVLENQGKVQPPTRLDSSWAEDPEELFLATARKSKEYSGPLHLDRATWFYYGFHAPYKDAVRKLTQPMLQDAVQATAQFLTRWMQAAQAASQVTMSCGTTGLLQFCCLDSVGNLWHQTCLSSGTLSGWGLVASQVKPDCGMKSSASCATNPSDQLYVAVISASGAITYTMRNSDGSWPDGWMSIGSAPNGMGTPVSVDCAIDGTGNFQLLTVDNEGTLWHTLQTSQGTWATNWGSVATQEGNDFGPKRMVSCAGDAQGGLHVLAIKKKDGTLWYTYRQPSGTWQANWQALNTTVAPVMHDLGHITCAVDASGTLHASITDRDANLWYTNRSSSGTWQTNWTRVSTLTPGTDRSSASCCGAGQNFFLMSVNRLGTPMLAERYGSGSPPWKSGWTFLGQPPY